MEFSANVAIPALVENHAVLQARTTSLFDKNAQPFARAFRIFGQHFFDLAGGIFGELDDFLAWRNGGHYSYILLREGGVSMAALGSAMRSQEDEK